MALFQIDTPKGLLEIEHDGDPAALVGAVDGWLKGQEGSGQTGTDMLKRVPAGIAKASADALVGMSRIGRMLPKEVVPVRGIIDAVAPGLQQKAEEYVAGLGESAPAAYGVDPTKNETIPSKLIAGAASIVPAIASGPAAPIAMAGMMGESQRQEAETAGATETQKTKAFVGGATVGALSEFLFGVPALLRSAKAAGIPEATFKAVAAEAAKQAVKTAGREGLQEGVEQIGQNIIASKIAAYDPERGTFENVPEAVALGAAVGGPVGATVQTAATLDAIRAQSKAIDTTIEEVATAEPPPVVVDVTQGGVRTEETFVPGQAEPETIITTPSAETPTGIVPEPSVTAETVAPGAQADIAAAAQAAGARYDTFDEQTGMHQITLMDEGGESTIYLKPEQATPEGIRDAIEYKRFEMAADSIDTPEKLDEFFRQQGISAVKPEPIESPKVQSEVPESKYISAARPKIQEALKLKPSQKHSSFVANHIIRNPDFPQNAYEWPIVEVVGTTVLRGGGESTSWHPHSTIRVNGKQVFREEKFRSGNTPLEELFGDRLLKVGRSGNADVYVLRPEEPFTAETSGAPQTPPTQPQPATATTEAEMVPGDRPQPEGAAQLSAAQLEERIDLLLQRHQSETDPAVQSKLWAEAKALLEQSNKAGGQSMGPGAASAAETLVKYAERKFGIRFQDDPRIAAELKQAAGNRFYEVLPNKVTAAEATELIDNLGDEQAERLIRDPRADTSFAVRSTVGQVLIQKLNQQYQSLKTTNPEQANAVLQRAADLAEWQMDFGTQLGQGVQAFAMWMRLTADGKLLSIKKAVRKARERHRKDNEADVDEVLGVLNTDRTVNEKENDVRKIAGRNKVARRIRKKVRQLAATKQTVESFYDTAAKELGLPELTAEQEGKLRELAAKVDAAPDGLPKWKAAGEFMRYSQNIKGFTTGDFALGYFYGNILSGLGTQIVNAADTFLNVIHEVNTLSTANPKAAATIYSGLARGIGSSKADAILALSQGRRISGTELGQSPAIMETAKFGEAGGVPITQSGVVSRIAKSVLESKVAAPLNAWKYIGRAMTASDSVMFRGAQEARAGLLAYRIATEEGLTTAQRTKRVNEILGWDRHEEFLQKAQEEGFTGAEQQARATELMIQQRPEGLNRDAAEFGTEATYNEKPKGVLGKAAQLVRAFSNEVPAFRLVVPFTNIVANVFNRRLDNLPGVAIYRARQGYYETPEAGKNALIRMTVSMGMLGAVMSLVEADVIDITGPGPDDPEKKKQLKETGWRPYSIKAGKQYISYANTPISLGLGIIGNMMDWGRYKKADEETNRSFAEAMTYSVFALGSYLFSQNFLSGMANFFEMLTASKGKAEASVRSFVANTTSAFVPMSNLLKDIDTIFDDTLKERKRMGAAIQSQIPFLRFAGKPALNAFGEPIHTGRIRPLTRFANQQREDPAWNLIADKQLRVPVPDPFFKTDAENYEYQKLSGQRLKKWVLENRQVLSSLPKEDAQEHLSEAGTNIRKAIRGELLMGGAQRKKDAQKAATAN